MQSPRPLGPCQQPAPLTPRERAHDRTPTALLGHWRRCSGVRCLPASTWWCTWAICRMVRLQKGMQKGCRRAAGMPCKLQHLSMQPASPKHGAVQQGCLPTSPLHPHAADGDPEVWDAFMDDISPLASSVPWMVQVGNHEGECLGP